MNYWLSDPGFLYVADELAKDRVVFLTGAGISYSLPGQSGSRLPSWRDLMLRLQHDAQRRSSLSAVDLADLHTLLDNDRAPPTSAHFLEAASILAKAVGNDFADIIARETLTKTDVTTATHLAISRCQPRAIITYNYDEGHEAAIKKTALPGDSLWEIILAADPDVAHSEKQIRVTLTPNGMRRKLIKAHGSVREPKSLVLTRESYREVLARRPAYRALLTHLFVNYTVVAVGFGMDDPDFQDSLDMLERDVGGHLGRHVFLTAAPRPPSDGDQAARAAYHTQSADQERRDVLMRRRYGFEPLRCLDYEDVGKILTDLQSSAGPELRAIVEASIDPAIDARGAAHATLSRLSESGALRAIDLIEKRLTSETDDWRAAEWCYSLGRIRPKQPRAKQILQGVIRDRRGVRSLANAVIALVEYADRNDIAWLRSELDAWRASPHPDEGGALDPNQRVRAYFEYAIQKTTAKYAAWNDPAPPTT